MSTSPAKRKRDYDRAVANRRDSARLTLRHAADLYAARHHLTCFKCHGPGPYAKARREPNGHRWAICTTCTTTNA